MSKPAILYDAHITEPKKLRTITCCGRAERDVQVKDKYFTWLSALAAQSWHPITIECSDCGARFQVLNGRARQTRKGVKA